MTFDDAFTTLMSTWLRHEDLKRNGGSIAELFQARLDLDRARYVAAVQSHR